jgi:hypothetical protein
MSDTLTFTWKDETGITPDQNPWKPIAGASVTIVNNSGQTLDISDIRNSCLKTKNGKNKKALELGTEENKNKWKGKAGKKGSSGKYTYDDGKPEAGPRSGTIDPS